MWDRLHNGQPAASEEYLNKIYELADLLQDQGHHVRHGKVPVDHEFAADLFMNLVGTGATYAVSGLAAGMQRPIGESTLEMATLRFYEHGMRLTGQDIMQALDDLNTVTRSVGRAFTDTDLVLSPVGVSDIPLLGVLNQNYAWSSAGAWRDHVFGSYPIPAIMNVTGQPAISIPMGLSSAGLPLGAHLIADLGHETRLLQVARCIECDRPWPLLAV